MCVFFRAKKEKKELVHWDNIFFSLPFNISIKMHQFFYKTFFFIVPNHNFISRIQRLIDFDAFLILVR